MYEEITNRNNLEGINILERLLNNQTVTRWECLKRRKQIYELIDNEEKYESIADEVLLLIEMAKESL